MIDNQTNLNLELFESFSVHLEKTYKFPPLAAKIQAYMVLYSGIDGFSFEDLLDVFKVSKSSLSTSINLLLSLNQLEYIHKIDSRKRFFRLNLNYLPEKLVFLHEIVIKDLYYTKRINEYKKQHKISNLIEENGVLDVYTQYLEESEKLLNEMINKIKTIQLENN